MGKHRVVATTAVLMLGACGGGKDTIDAAVISDAAPDVNTIDAPPDAPNYDFTCFGATPPAAAATVTLSGTAQELQFDLVNFTFAVVPLAAATIDSCPSTSTTCPSGQRLDQQTTASNGTFTTAAISTGAVPLDAYVKGTKTNYRPTYVYPPRPFTSDQAQIPVVTLTNSNFSIAVNSGLLPVTHNAGNGLIATIVTDCGFLPIAAATISVKQGGNEVSAANKIDGSLFGQGGGEVRFDVPPGDVVVTASYMGMDFPAHTVHVFADSTTNTGVRPGP